MAMGRPRKEFSKEQFEYLCALQCTESEICSFFKVTSNTLVDRVKEWYDGKTFSEVRPLLAEAGKVSLRRAQFRLAKKSATMAQWLGMQMLDQKQPAREQIVVKSDTHVHTEAGEAVVHIHAIESQQVRIAEPATPSPTFNSNGNGNHKNGNGAHADAA